MLNRRTLLVSALLGFALVFAGCGDPGLDAIAISPGAQALSAAGETVQFTAIGAFHHGTSTRDITALVTWKSSDAAVATISASGLATAGAGGVTTITASMPGIAGVTVGSATITVSPSTGSTLAALTILPTSQAVNSLNETGQFIAVGAFGTGGTAKDLTNVVAWSSSDVKVATVNSSGLVTGLNVGSTTITAIATGSDGTVVTATSTFSELDGGGDIIPTLTVYKVGKNAATGTVTGINSDTGPRLVINCGTGLGCVGHFRLNSSVTLTEIPGPNSIFAGWSVPTCNPPSTPPPSMCTIPITDNDTVGAIFN